MPLRSTFAAVALAVAGLAPAETIAQPAAAAPIVAIADVHGAYEPFVELLQAAAVVDPALGWIGGAARLVIVGDLLDRGARSRDVVELLMKLQDDAARAGGAVHVVLGNHEVMNLVGDLGYVSPAEYAAFAAEELAAEREAAWQRFTAADASIGRGGTAARDRFTERYPPGFFAHRAAFGSTGRYGRWLLSQPVLLVLDGNAFVHGGLPEDTAGMSAVEINTAYSSALHDYLRAFDTLVGAGLLHAEDAFADRPAIAAAAAASSLGIEAPVPAAIERLDELTRAPPFGPDAVYWYRGTATCSAAFEADRLERALRLLGAHRVVLGHTPTVPRGVLSRFDGRVLRADTGMQQDSGRPAAVILRGREVEVLYAGAADRTAPEPQATGVAAFALGVTDSQLERWLATAPITARTAGPDGRERITLDASHRQIAALFRSSGADARDDRALHEVAAYRLDRMLELGLVPAAVPREIDGVQGAVRVDVDAWPDESARASGAQQSAEWCPLADQFALTVLFDALAGAEPREPGALRYVAGVWQLALTRNGRLFSASNTLPEHLRSAPIRLSPSIAARLEALSADSLAAELGDVLDERRRNALLVRRDRLLRIAQRD
jgi:hypothetical protein